MKKEKHAIEQTICEILLKHETAIPLAGYSRRWLKYQRNARDRVSCRIDRSEFVCS